MDEFTIIRITKIIGSYKKTHGHDISEAELAAQGIDNAAIDYLVRRGIVDKYQATTGKGNQENRFKLHRDWRSLRDPSHK